MNLTRKNIITFIIIGILVPGVPFIILCSAYCVSIDPNLDSPMDGGCPFSYDPSVDIAVVLSALLALPFAGLFFVRDWQFIPPGVYWLLYRPPRFSR